MIYNLLGKYEKYFIERESGLKFKENMFKHRKMEHYTFLFPNQIVITIKFEEELKCKKTTYDVIKINGKIQNEKSHEEYIDFKEFIYKKENIEEEDFSYKESIEKTITKRVIKRYDYLTIEKLEKNNPLVGDNIEKGQRIEYFSFTGFKDKIYCYVSDRKNDTKKDIEFTKLEELQKFLDDLIDKGGN